jgi:hypothetical protein
MSVYATWTIDEGNYRGVVICSKTFDTTMRTDCTFRTPEEATAAARTMIDALVSA